MAMQLLLLAAKQDNLDCVVVDQASGHVPLGKSKSVLQDSSRVDRDSSTVVVT